MRDLTRWFDDMGRHLDRLFDDVDTLMTDIFPDLQGASAASYEVAKEKDTVTIRVAVPGCTDKDVQVVLHEGIITVTASNRLARIAPHQGDESLQRVHKFQVGPKVKVEDISATVAHGMLTVVVKREVQPVTPSGAVKINVG